MILLFAQPLLNKDCLINGFAQKVGYSLFNAYLIQIVQFTKSNKDDNVSCRASFI